MIVVCPAFNTEAGYARRQKLLDKTFKYIMGLRKESLLLGEE